VAVEPTESTIASHANHRSTDGKLWSAGVIRDVLHSGALRSLAKYEIHDGRIITTTARNPVA
jgi:hypothetical protein